MEIIGKSTINPFVFYSGKISGYIAWAALLYEIIRISNFNIFHYIALSLTILGFFISILSLFNLGASTRFGLPEKETILKTGGLYRFSRNPIYLGFLLLADAAILISFNIWMIMLAVYSTLTYHLIILSEEKFLEKRFGADYTAYKKKVRRYL